ncbi:MAG: Rpp14/Pop5 family protein [Candidatus Woesearchaeota archaeon]
MFLQPQSEKREPRVRCDAQFSRRTSAFVHAAQPRPKMAQQSKSKPLLPVLKEKKRYLAYRLHGDLPRNAGNLLAAELEKLLGVFEASEAGLLPITYDPEAKTGVLRTSLAKVRRVRLAMLLATALGGKDAVVEPTLTSGVLKKAKQAM